MNVHFLKTLVISLSEQVVRNPKMGVASGAFFIVQLNSDVDCVKNRDKSNSDVQ